jgi:nucleotide-binding universal stress UspA family protein
VFQHILIPLDGSARAERAIPIAARIAKASRSSLILLRVVTPSVEDWPILETTPQSSLARMAVNDETLEAKQYLAALASSPDLSGLSIETVVLFGAIAPTILSVAYSYQADIIVLCSHGAGGTTRWVLGGIAEKVARNSLVPVFILREDELFSSDRPINATHPLRVLLPLDGSSSAKEALLPAAFLTAALSAPNQGSLRLLRVARPSAAPDESNEQRAHSGDSSHAQRAKKYLTSLVESLHKGNSTQPISDLQLAITWSVVINADVAEAIVHETENGKEGCDVIAVATHGHGGLQRWTMGSITERLLSATRLSLLVVRPPILLKSTHPVWETHTATFQP